MASNTGSANPAEATPDGSGVAPIVDGRVWGLTTAATRGTSGPGGNVQGNGKGSDFKC